MTGRTTWWWIRHAPVPEAAGRIYGQLDRDCMTHETEKFTALARLLPTSTIDFMSPLKRTWQTHAAIAAAGEADQRPPRPKPTIEPAFIEQNFGRWQGMTWPDMQALEPDVYAQFWTDPTRNTPPEGESFADQMARVGAGIERLTEAHAGETIVSVSHGGTIRAAIAFALGLSPPSAMAIAIDNLSVTRLSYLKGGTLRGRGAAWMVELVNAPSLWLSPETAC